MTPGSSLLGATRPGVRTVRTRPPATAPSPHGAAAVTERWLAGTTAAEPGRVGAPLRGLRSPHGAVGGLAAARTPTAGGRAPGLYLLDRLRR